MATSDNEKWVDAPVASGEQWVDAPIRDVKADTEKKPELSTGKKVLDYASRGLDYAGGMARQSIMQSPAVTALDLLQSYLRKKPMLNQPGDFENALVGKAPRTADYLQRGGVPNGAMSDLLPNLYTNTPEEANQFLRLKMAKGGLLDPTIHGTAGLVGDIATDPLTYTGVGELKAMMPKGVGSALEAVSRPVGNAVEKMGEKYFKSGWKRLDEGAKDFSANRVGTLPSEVGLNKGIWGNERGIEQQVDNVLDKLSDVKTNEIMPQINGPVNSRDAWNQEVKDRLTKLSKDPSTMEVLHEAADKMKSFNRRGNVPPEDMWLWQKNLGKEAAGSPGSPGNSFKDIRSYDHMKEAEKDMYHALGDHLVNKAEESSPGLGQQLLDVNAEMTPLLGAKRALRSGAKNEATRKGWLSKFDGYALGAGLLGTGAGHEMAFAPYLASKAAQALTSPTARTGGGLLMNRLGDKMVETNADALIRQKLIDALSQDDSSVWNKMTPLQVR